MRKTIDHQTGDGLGLAAHRMRNPLPGVGTLQHDILRSITTLGVIDERQHDSEQDPLLDPDEHDRQRRDYGHPELRLPLPEDALHLFDLDQVEADQKHDRRQHRLGHVGQRRGEKEQHQHDDANRSEVRQLSAATGAVDHLGLGRTAGNDEGPGQPGADICQPHRVEVDVLIEALVVLRCERTRGCGALGKDDHEHGECDGREPADEVQAPVDLGQGEMRQATGHGTEHMHGAAEIERPARGNGAGHGNQRPRDALRDLPCADDDDEYGKRNSEGFVVDVVDLLDVEPRSSAGCRARHP